MAALRRRCDDRTMNLRPTTLIAMVASMVFGIAIGVTAYQSRSMSQPPTAEVVAQVLQQINSAYVTEVPQDELLGNALRGMLDGLDPHSVYLDPSDYGDLQADTSGHFGGIGIQLGLVENAFTVIAPIDATPAARAGLQAGDVLTAVDGEPIKGTKLRDVVTLLRGEPGTEVELGIRRAEADELTIALTRAVIAVSSVSEELLPQELGYVRISQFQSNTAKELEQAVARLKHQAEGKLSGLILDLRNNPGGVLQQSVAVADGFLEDGLIVYTDGRQRSSKLRFSASGSDWLNGAPMAVLINRGSASASEIVAGALQDHKRAVVFGEQSFGKGSVQSILPLSDDDAIKLTTALYYTPNGRSIHNKGITPDVVSELNGAELINFVAQQLQPAADPLHASNRS